MIKYILRPLFLLSALVILLITGCKKEKNTICPYDDTPAVASAAEIAFLQDYVTTHSLNLQQHSSGVFFVIDSTGSGTSPSLCSVIRVKYEGWLLNGNLVDYNYSTTGISFTLGELIKGWQMLLPLIKPGGAITLYIPPSLAYGTRTIRDNNGNVIIPSGSYMIFDISLLDVQ